MQSRIYIYLSLIILFQLTALEYAGSSHCLQSKCYSKRMEFSVMDHLRR